MFQQFDNVALLIIKKNDKKINTRLDDYIYY